MKQKSKSPSKKLDFIKTEIPKLPLRSESEEKKEKLVGGSKKVLNLSQNKDISRNLISAREENEQPIELRATAEEIKQIYDQKLSQPNLSQ